MRPQSRPAPCAVRPPGQRGPHTPQRLRLASPGSLARALFNDMTTSGSTMGRDDNSPRGPTSSPAQVQGCPGRQSITCSQRFCRAAWKVSAPQVQDAPAGTLPSGHGCTSAHWPEDAGGSGHESPSCELHLASSQLRSACSRLAAEPVSATVACRGAWSRVCERRYHTAKCAARLLRPPVMLPDAPAVPRPRSSAWCRRGHARSARASPRSRPR